MKFFLLTDKGYFHYTYDERTWILNGFFPQKVPNLVLFNYGQVYNDKSYFLKKFVPGRDFIILRSSDNQICFLIYSDEALRQRIKLDEPGAAEGDEGCIADIKDTKKRLAENRGQMICDALERDTLGRTTYEVIRDLAFEHGWYGKK